MSSMNQVMSGLHLHMTVTLNLSMQYVIEVAMDTGSSDSTQIATI